jgi:hypothetical protein
VLEVSKHVTLRFDGLHKSRIDDYRAELSGTLTGPTGLTRVSIVEVAGAYVLALPYRLAKIPVLNGEPAVLRLGVVESRSESSRFAAPLRFIPAGCDADAPRFAESVFPPLEGQLQIRLVFEQDGRRSAQVVTIGADL